jgi:hypothetical protein
LTTPIPAHTDYCQKRFNKYASCFQPKKKLWSQKRETGIDVPNKQAHRRRQKEEDLKAKKVVDIDARRDKAPTSFQIAEIMVQKASKAVYPGLLYPPGTCVYAPQLIQVNLEEGS